MGHAGLSQQIMDTVQQLPATLQQEWHNLQNAQVTALIDLWDNPEDEVWNDA